VAAQTDLELIQKIWFGTVEEAVEAVQAAATLGFGVSLRNESVPDEEEPTTSSEQWVVEIFHEAPTAEPEPASA
jgi:hypothetical protein